MQCMVPFCENIYKVDPSQATGITFHRLPSEECLRAVWLKALGRQNARPPDSAVVCSQHFLNEDFYVTESGMREISPGAIPSSVLVCMACLDTDSELLLLSKHKLLEAYEQLTRHSCDVGNLQQTLCVQCAQTVRDFSRFREQSWRARSLMMHLLQTHGLITRRHLELIKREGELKSEPVTSPLEADDCVSHMDHDYEDSQTAPEEDDNVEVKREHDSPSVEIEIDVFIPEVPVLDPLKTEDYEDSSVALPSRLATNNEYKARATDGADTTQRRERARATDSGALHNRPTDSDDDTRTDIRHCVVVLYDDVSNNPTFVSKQNESLKQTRQADSAYSDSLNTDIACKDAQYRAASESEADGKNRTDEKHFVCDLCEYKSRYKCNLARHVKTHTGEKLFVCKYCEFKCADKGSLVRHTRTHTGEKPYACKYCEFKCANETSLVRHKRTHTGEKPYACKYCEFKCADNSTLVRHTRTHTGAKPFSCKLCKYKCTSSSSLVTHMKTHTGEKPFACELCEYKCAQMTSLNIHMRTHTGEKPYACTYCKFKCAYKNSLVRHNRTHTGEKPYACKYCEFKCAESCKLVRHIRTHTGAKPFSCKLCKYKCIHSSSLVTHMKSHEGGN